MSQRPGAFAIYLEPWHPDVFDFLDLRKNHGSEEKVYASLYSLPSKLPDSYFHSLVYVLPVWSKCPRFIVHWVRVKLALLLEPNVIKILGGEGVCTWSRLCVSQGKRVFKCAYIFILSYRGPGTCSMHCGCQISSCVESSPMKTGHWCAPTSAPGWPTLGGRSLSVCRSSMRRREEPRRWWRHRSCGSPYSRLRLRRAHHTCCTKTPATERAINRY